MIMKAEVDQRAAGDPLTKYRDIWLKKPVLRTVYGDFYDRIAAACNDGLTMEIGAGISNLPEKLPDVIGSDIQFAPWLNLVADAQRLPFAAGALGNIVMVDVLHHIEHPLNFFREAARVLKPGGRIVMIEPGITLLSWPFYHFIHEEPVVMSDDPLTSGIPDADRDPYTANQAIPTLIAARHRERFHGLCPELTIRKTVWFSSLSYPLSGGFKWWSLLTAGLARRVMKCERRIEPKLGRYLGFRLLLVIEKKNG